jgi:endonuclease/exonuclease/phosphatase family metal-dependent hydrolase
MSSLAHLEGSKLILQKIAEIQKAQKNDPQIIMGDFNCAPGSLPHCNFTENDFIDIYLGAGNEDTEDSDTFHDFKGWRYPGCHRSERLGWILLKECR